jgi:sulfoxide reductase catalytic subunit YedY
MIIKRRDEILPSEITPRGVYEGRRRFIGLAAGATILGAAGPLARAAPEKTLGLQKLENVEPSRFSTREPLTAYRHVTGYNNFYEFGTEKDDPARYAGRLMVRPWTVAVEGEVAKPRSFGIEELLGLPLEERIYRLRCVEAWSMVIPWVGIPLAGLLQRFEPGSGAKYVKFTTVMRPQEMPGQRREILDWPYVEGLTIAEAMHPLALMAVGVYGRELPNQNGAPMRLVVPWKYGFKSIKSIDRIEFTAQRPVGSWERAIPQEYGFYANVNPEVDHPRWSQASERPIGAGLFGPRRPTVMFNGYADEVASLYAGLDLRRNY